MNYLTEIKLFYDWLEMHPLTPSAISLWHGLMFMANRCGWEEQFSVPLSVLETRTGIPSSTLYRTRKMLEDEGLIEVSSPGGSSCAVYRILPFEQRFVSRGGKQNESPAEDNMGDKVGDKGLDSQFVSQSGKQNESINKTKLNMSLSTEEKEKKKKGGKGKTVFSLEDWVSEVESPWRELMRIWLEYKKARKEAYSSEMGAKACLTKLRNLSGNNPDTAQAIIDQSMANNWAGLFPLNDQNSRGRSASGFSSGGITPATGQRIGQIMQPESEEHRNAILEKFKKKAAEDMSHRPGTPENPKQ